MISNASCVLSRFPKREKFGTFSLSFLAVTLTLYDIIAAPNFKLKLWYVYVMGSKALSWRQKF